jgi:hypothetical protein
MERVTSNEAILPRLLTYVESERHVSNGGAFDTAGQISRAHMVPAKLPELADALEAGKIPKT